jgi:hypothetical protein
MERRAGAGPLKPTYRRLDEEEAPPPPLDEPLEELPAGPIVLGPRPPPPEAGSSRDRREERVRRYLVLRKTIPEREAPRPDGAP